MKYCWEIFPKRDVPSPYPAFAAAFRELRIAGAPLDDLAKSAHGYSEYVMRNKVDPKFVKTIHRFYADDTWKAYCIATVEGRTRDEWARSGQDVIEFDLLSKGV
jgi:hypothetical protein